MNKKYKISIVLPNWNGAYLMEKNLSAVIEAAPGAQIVVADDASSDNSIKLLKDKFKTVVVVENKKRQGFAGNVNSAVAAADGDIVVLINTDVRPRVGFLNTLLPHFDDDRVFAVGCLEESHEKDQIILRGRGVASWRKGFFIHQKGAVNKTDTAWVSGGSGAFRKKYWELLGGMDTLYNPFYWEDIDLSYRALKAGYKIYFEPKSIVGHYHEEGKIIREYTPRDVKKISYRNQFIFIWKNLSDQKQIIQHVLYTPIRIIQNLIYGEPLMLTGFFMALIKLPTILKSRSRSSRIWRLTDHEIFPT